MSLNINGFENRGTIWRHIIHRNRMNFHTQAPDLHDARHGKPPAMAK
jgi:hypothetical protein